MFRSERPQAGRLRQFHQVGVELIGTANPLSDAEAIHCLDVFLREAGVQNGWEIRVNNLGTFQERAGYKVKLSEFLTPKISKLCADCQKRYHTNVLRILDCKNDACREVVRRAPVVSESLGAESQAYFQDVLGALRSLVWMTPIKEDPYMVRGLDYYTKTVFEIVHDGLGAQDALAAGGRYDSLVESFGGPKIGAVGFAAGVERMASLIHLKSNNDKLRSDTVFIATLGQEARKRGFSLLSNLRENHQIRTIADFDSGSLKSQLRAAIKNGARWAVIIGDDELKKGKEGTGVFQLKDLSVERGIQEEYELHDAPNILKKKTAENV